MTVALTTVRLWPLPLSDKERIKEENKKLRKLEGISPTPKLASNVAKSLWTLSFP